MNFEKISPLHAEMVRDKYIRAKQHPAYPELWLLNYSEKAQFDRKWNYATLNSRGTVYTENGLIVARPFKKFFNASEHPSSYAGTLPDETFEVYEKLDGSAGICFFYDNRWHMATRGSFNSDFALIGQDMLYGKYAENTQCMNPEYTYMFEIICPENRIVVDYKGISSLVLLGAIHTSSGIELDFFDAHFSKLTFERPKVYAADDLEVLASTKRDNFEGYVVKFQSGLRVKVKLDEYVRLHRIKSNWTPLRIYEALQAKTDMTSFLKNVPDEFYNEIVAVEKKARHDFQVLKSKYTYFYDLLMLEYKDRKNAAAAIINFCKDDESFNSSIFFSMLDKRHDNVEELIWKQLYTQAKETIQGKSK